VLGAFDLLELDGADLRRLPIEQRKRALARLVGAGGVGRAARGGGRMALNRKGRRLS
jgi:ATP-dependent DNA ligase